MAPFFETNQCICSDRSTPCSSEDPEETQKPTGDIKESDYKLVGNYYCKHTKCIGADCSANSLGECITMALQDPECLDNGKYVVFGNDIVGKFCGCGFYKENTCDIGVRDENSNFALYQYSKEDTEETKMPTDGKQLNDEDDESSFNTPLVIGIVGAVVFIVAIAICNSHQKMKSQKPTPDMNEL